MIYFDNSATTYPKPPQVETAVLQGVREYGGNPGRGGHDISMRVTDLVYRTRVKAADLFGVWPEQVVFTENCTMSLNIAVGSIPDGSDVIISDLEHNAVLRPLAAAKAAGRLSFRVFDTGRDNRDFVRRLAAFVKPETRAVVMTAASNVTGRILPVREIGEFCRKNRLLWIVDGAQAAGVIPLDCRENQIDILCTSGHKGLYGITGTGLILTGEDVKLRPLLYGGTGTASLSAEQPDLLPESLEAGTLPTVGICALRAGMEYLSEEGIRQLTGKSLALCAELYERLLFLPQAKLYSPRPQWGNSIPVVSFGIRGHSSETIAAKLNEAGFALRGGYQCAALAHRKLGTTDCGVVRFSPGSFNTEQETEQLADCIQRIAAEN